MIVVEPKQQENPGEVKAKDTFKNNLKRTPHPGVVSESTGIILTRVHKTDDRETDQPMHSS
jgi:hypothetical protein